MNDRRTDRNAAFIQPLLRLFDRGLHERVSHRIFTGVRRAMALRYQYVALSPRSPAVQRPAASSQVRQGRAADSGAALRAVSFCGREDVRAIALRSPGNN